MTTENITGKDLTLVKTVVSRPETGSGSGPTGNSGSTVTIIVTPPAPDKPDSPTQAEIKVPVTVDSNNNAVLNITSQIVTDAFEKALAAAKEKGNEEKIMFHAAAGFLLRFMVN